MRITVQLESPESLEGLAAFAIFLRGSKRVFDRKRGGELSVTIQWTCIDSRGRRFNICDSTLLPEEVAPEGVAGSWVHR